MPKVPVFAGERFGELTAVRFIPGTREDQAKWLCKCSCGKEVRIPGRNLRYGKPKSCGCINKRKYKHGMSGTPLFWVWHSMLYRCENPKDPNYHHYGGRGITVCDRWHEFINFYADMGPPVPGKSIDRIDNNGPYSPENCRWASQQEQMNNRRGLNLITHNGVNKTAAAWSRELGIHKSTILWRRQNGWPESKLLIPPGVRP